MDQHFNMFAVKTHFIYKHELKIWFWKYTFYLFIYFSIYFSPAASANATMIALIFVAASFDTDVHLWMLQFLSQTKNYLQKLLDVYDVFDKKYSFCLNTLINILYFAIFIELLWYWFAALLQIYNISINQSFKYFLYKFETLVKATLRNISQ